MHRKALVNASFKKMMLAIFAAQAKETTYLEL